MSAPSQLTPPHPRKRSKGARGPKEDDNDKVPRRVPLACVSCRTRKIRCPAQQPACSICIADGRECSYVKVTAAENAAARAKKHQSKLAKAARAADGLDTHPKTATVKGKGKEKVTTATESKKDDCTGHRHHSLPNGSELPASYELPTHAIPVVDIFPPAAPATFPLNLPSLGSAHYNHPASTFQSSQVTPTADGFAATHHSFLLPTPPAEEDVHAPAFPAAALASSCPPADGSIYALPPFYSLPTAVTPHLHSSHLRGYSMSSQLDQILASTYSASPQPPSSYMSPPSEPFTLARGGRSGSNSSSAYVDQASSSAYAGSEAGSDADQWAAHGLLAKQPASHTPHSHTHLRHSSQPNLSVDLTSPFLGPHAHLAAYGSLPLHQLPHTVPVHQQPFSSLGLYPNTNLAQHHTHEYDNVWNQPLP